MKIKILRPNKLAKMLGISRTTLWRLEQSNDFPPKIKITSLSVGWRKSDIKAWLISREIENIAKCTPKW